MVHPLRAHLLQFVPALTEKEWAPLAATLRPLHLRRGEHFVQAGEYQPQLALALSGACRVYYTWPDEDERTITSSSSCTC